MHSAVDLWPFKYGTLSSAEISLSFVVNPLCNVSALLLQYGSIPSILGMRITVFAFPLQFSLKDI